MFQDKAKGEARELADMQTTRDVERLVFQMASSVAQLKRQVDALGTAKDTVDHRHRLAEQNGKVQGLARQIKERLTAQSEDKGAQSPPQVAKTRKLMQDFAAILQDYKATQKVAAEREASSLPKAPPVTQQRAAAAAAAMAASASAGVDADIENQALLQQHQQEQARVMDNAISYNEALIEERDQGIAEIQRQIGEVNEMFQDLAVLINDQGEQLQTIDVQISSTAERVREGGQQLVAADRSQRAARNKCLMLWLVSGIVVAIILVVLFA